MAVISPTSQRKIRKLGLNAPYDFRWKRFIRFLYYTTASRYIMKVVCSHPFSLSAESVKDYQRIQIADPRSLYLSWIVSQLFFCFVLSVKYNGRSVEVTTFSYEQRFKVLARQGTKGIASSSIHCWSS